MQDNDHNGTCTPACAASTCTGHGMCSDTTGTAVCTCDRGREGADCGACSDGAQDNDDDGDCEASCDDVSCSEAGACEDDSGAIVCTCEAGRAGMRCESCAEGLQDNDLDLRCTPACDDDTCSGHGECDDSSGAAVCDCEEGLTGTDCSECASGLQDRDGDGTCAPACMSDTCSGRGVCDDAGGVALCVCDEGYSGADCSECAALFQDNDDDGTCNPACHIESCAHGGCADATGVVVCTCDVGYAGDDCSDCAEGYQDNDIDGSCDLACTATTCSGHGTCIDFDGPARCACTAAYTGAACADCADGFQDLDDDGTCAPACGDATCTGHGDCEDATGTAVCSCDTGYDGADCADCAAGYQDNDDDGRCARSCQASTCSGHGTCSDTSGITVCTCDSGFNGADCSGCATGYQDRDGDGVCRLACSDTSCSGHGSCEDSTGTAICTCDVGHTGTACATCSSGYQDNDGNGACALACDPSTCNGHGGCSDTSGTRICTCAAGYTGTFCGTCASGYQDNDNNGSCTLACDGSTCNGHGTCADTSGTRVCTCGTGYSGAFCASCAANYQDNDNNGSCSPACSVTTCAESCSDTSGTATCVCAPGCGGATYCRVDRCLPIFVNTSGATTGNAFSPHVSSDGRYVSFHSTGAPPGIPDTTALRDVYVFDRVTGFYDRVSLANDGSTEGNGDASDSDLSDDGRFVSFVATSSNLVPADLNGGGNDVFVFDRAGRTLEHLSAGIIAGTSADDAAMDASGNLIAFRSNSLLLVAGANGQTHVMVRDRSAGTTEIASVSTAGTQGNGQSSQPALSATGRYVVFVSLASNLVAGDTNGVADVFLRDRMAGTTEMVSLADDESLGNGTCFEPRVSEDGRYVSFASQATNLVPGDTNMVEDIFVRDRMLATTTRINVTNAGVQANGGQHLNGDVTYDGRYFAFTSGSTNLASSDTNSQNDVFIWDRVSATLRTLSSSTSGVIGDQASDNARFSSTGRYVVFNSRATNLIAGAGAGALNDVLLRDLDAP